jgi:formylglycine-generating enzyme required for sulfatase activity
MKKFNKIKILVMLICVFTACKQKSNQPPSMISIPQFEYVSEIKENGSTKNLNISIDAFYISNEITNREYREFTDWVRDNPDEILAKPKEITGEKNPETGMTRVWTIPNMVRMSDLLPFLIDSNAMFKIDKKYKNYFIDEKYNDYPVVGVSRNAAEYFCTWLIALERQTFVILRKGQKGIDGKRSREKIMGMSSPGYGYYRLPLAAEWEYVSKQPYKRKFINDHELHRASEGIKNRWGIIHLHDNVSEWITMPGDTLAVCRGDNWLTKDGPMIQGLHPDSSKGYIGFRVARTFKPEQINSKKSRIRASARH